MIFPLLIALLWPATPQDTGAEIEYLASLLPASRYQEFIYYDIQAVRRETAADPALAAYIDTLGELSPGSILDELPGFRADEVANLLIAIISDRCTLRITPLDHKAENPQLDKGSSFIFSTSEIELTLDDRRVTGDVEGDFVAVITLLDPSRVAQRLAAETTPAPPKPSYRKKRVFKLGGGADDSGDVEAWLCAWSPELILVAGSESLLEKMILAGDGLSESLADSPEFRNLMGFRGELGACVDFQDPQAPYLLVMDEAEKRESLRGPHLDRLRAEFEERAGAYRIRTLRFGASIAEVDIDIHTREEDAIAAERERRSQLRGSTTGTGLEARRQRLRSADTVLERDGATLRETFTPGPEYLRLFAIPAPKKR